MPEDGRFWAAPSSIWRSRASPIRTVDPRRREALQEILVRAVTERVKIHEQTAQLARQIQERGIAGFNALHLACAAQAVDVFLTIDERLVRRANRMSDLVTIPVSLPLRWLEPMTEEGDQP